MAETKTKKQVHLGTGRRKTSVARVRVTEGTGVIMVNDKPFDIFFTEEKDRMAVVGPIEVTNLRGRLDITVHVHGGGVTGQAGAACQGIARAIKKMFNLVSSPEPVEAAAEGAAPAAEDPMNAMSRNLRVSGFLTRDGRMKERKKYGHKGARKSFQFSKR